MAAHAPPRGRGSRLTTDARRLEALRARYGFALDDFQVRALDALSAGESVLVAAPTGSGKTVVAECAIDDALARGERAFYTAPIKALSNQKYHDLVARLGAGTVGLLTGDRSVNAGAPVVVMTTEVLRNMIYASSDALGRLGVVVLDEVHFIQDAYRGPVWEEVIIHLEPEVRLVCLSATVSNADEVAEWLTLVRGPTRAIVESRRPVELRHHFALGDRASHEVRLYDTLVDGRPNARAAERAGARTGDGRRRRAFAPNRLEMADVLVAENMLPAIVFIFSRAQCDEAAETCRRAGLRLTDADERAEIARLVDEGTSTLAEDDLAALGFSRFADQLESGIAAHHAGMVPAFKEVVERCFAAGLVKLVFATETLAVGLNMPARAVVIEKLSKYTGDHHEMLRPYEYAQLTGRAGRRGIDVVGHAISLWNPYVSFDQAAALAASRSFRLQSAFRPTCNMAANLIATHSRGEAHHLLNLSFAQFQSGRDVVEVQARIARRSRERDRLRSQARSPYGDLEEYRASAGGSRSGGEVAEALRALRPGDVVELRRDDRSTFAAVVSTAQRAGGTRLQVVAASRATSYAGEDDFDEPPVPLARVALPEPYAPTSERFVREVAQRVGRLRLRPRPGRGRAARRGGDAHPVAADPDLRARLQAAESADRIDREIGALERRLDAGRESVRRRFDDVVALLERRGCVDGWALTDKGRVLARVFHEMDLLVVEAIARGHLDGLDAPELAALCSTLVYEARGAEERPDPRMPTATLRARWRDLSRTARELRSEYEALGVGSLREPDPGFVPLAHEWAAGAALADVLEDAELSAGDFVRTSKQLADLLRQVALVAGDGGLRTVATDAAAAVDRGIVAYVGAGA